MADDKKIQILEELDEELDSSPAKLSDILMQAHEDDEIALTVSRKLKGKKTAFLFELDDYENLPALQSKLRDEYEGGEFLIEGRRNNGAWAVKQSINIEAPKKDEAIVPQNDNFQSVLLAMQQNSEKSSRESRELMMEMSKQAMAQQTANMDMLFKMMGTKEAPQPQMSMVEMMTFITTLQSNNKPASDPIDMLMRGLEMGKELGGGGGDENVLATAIKAFGPAISTMTEQLGNVPTPPALPATNVAQPLAPIPEEQLAVHTMEEEKEMFELLKFKPIFNVIVKAAQANGDIDRHVQYMRENVNKETIEKYLSDDYYAQLYTLMPNLVNVKPWLDKFRSAILQLDSNVNDSVDAAPEQPDDFYRPENVHERTEDATIISDIGNDNSQDS